MNTKLLQLMTLHYGYMGLMMRKSINIFTRKINFNSRQLIFLQENGKCATEKLKLIEPITNKGRLVKIRVFNYRANNVLPLSYQSGFKSRQQLFDEAPLLTIKILDLDVVPFYFLEWLQPTSSADRTFIKEKIHGQKNTGNCRNMLILKKLNMAALNWGETMFPHRFSLFCRNENSRRKKQKMPFNYFLINL